MKELSVHGIVDLASAFYGSAVLFSGIENRVFEIIERQHGRATVQSVAAEAQCSERGMRLLLDACAALGLLVKKDGFYSNTEAGEAALVPGGKADLTRAVMYNRDVYPAWGRLSALVGSGQPVERPEAHLGGDKARTGRFAASMRGRALAIGRAVAGMVDLGGCSRLLDLAGGPGTYAEMFARRYPGLKCVTVDVPAVSEAARDFVAADGLSDVVECRAGDYHTDVYEAEHYDAATIFGALHQESPEQIVDILKRTAHALKPGGRLYVLDMMTDATHTEPVFSALFAVNMALTTHNGWVFSDEELKGWMREAGFRPGRTRPAPPPMPHWLVDAVRL